MSEDGVEFTEERIPLEGIDRTAAELVRLYGGNVRSTGSGRMEFTLPLRRGVATAGGVGCSLSWRPEAEGGVVTIVAEREVEAPKLQQILLLVFGSVGALLWILWPFFPSLGALSWIGAAVAFATYFMSLRRTRGGLVADFLQRLARTQREGV